jgi:hypothetical protein
MKFIKVVLTSLLLNVAAAAQVVTYTPNLNLAQPPQGYANYAYLMNNNLSLLDNAYFFFRGAWSSTVTYQRGAWVTYGGSLYVSTVNGNLNNIPGSSPQWTFVITNGSLPTLNANQFLAALVNGAATAQNIPDCHGTSNALQWTAGVGMSCGSISGSGGGGLFPSTTAIIAGTMSGVYDDNDSNSRNIGIPTSVSCVHTTTSTCTVVWASAHGLRTPAANVSSAVDMTSLSGWPVTPLGAVQQSAQYGSFQVTTVPNSTSITFTTPTTLTYSCSPCTGNVYDASYWAIWQFAAQSNIYGHGTVYGIEQPTSGIDANWTTVTSGITGSPIIYVDQSGQNDFASGASVATVEASHKSVWAKAHAAGMKVYQTTMVPSGYGLTGVDIKPVQLNYWYWWQSCTAALTANGQCIDSLVDTAHALMKTDDMANIPNQQANAIFAATVANAFNGTPRWPDPVVYGSFSASGLASDFPAEVIKSWRKFTYDNNWNLVEDFNPGSNARTFNNNIFLPTATPGTNNTQAASTAFVQAAIAAAGSGGGTVTYTTSATASTSDNGKLVILNCSAACAYTLPNPQPSTTWNAWIMTIGSTDATIALGSTMTFNGGASVPVLNKFRTMQVRSNSATATAYNGEAPLVQGANMTFTQNANGMMLASSGGGSSILTTKGDLLSHTTTDVRVAVGADGSVPIADSTQTVGWKWAAIAGSVPNIQITTNTTAVAANTCNAFTTTAMTGVTTASVFNFTPTTDTHAVTGWGGTGGLVFQAYPTANTLNWTVCNQTASSITPSSSVTWNVGAASAGSSTGSSSTYPTWKFDDLLGCCGNFTTGSGGGAFGSGAVTSTIFANGMDELSIGNVGNQYVTARYGTGTGSTGDIYLTNTTGTISAASRVYVTGAPLGDTQKWGFGFSSGWSAPNPTREMDFVCNQGQGNLNWWAVGASGSTDSGVACANQWVQLEIKIVSGAVTWYVNGTSVKTDTVSTLTSAWQLGYVVWNSPSGAPNGQLYIDWIAYTNTPSVTFQ